MESNDVRPKSKSGQDAEPGFPPVSRLIKVSGIVLKMPVTRPMTSGHLAIGPLNIDSGRFVLQNGRSWNDGNGNGNGIGGGGIGGA